ncbi:probable G-protein coupled receptor 148 [Xenopus laevis]|uniref:G-protein coupled receptors family 1 profile domain-containing protein n=2 Tax=Xenopus laevis TaxID=8355 RepID=A0A974HKF7_XENLA|nr:probable G-protein coupled receptor 148 [Xenopus laevis]OCT81050.1 hypothetical protein XELAEV_18027863mg [Xenopus laevis]
MNSTKCHAPLISQRSLNLSRTIDDTFLHKEHEWITNPPVMEIKLFFIPAATCFIVAVFATAAVLLTILSTFSLRKETRFILMGNALLSDLLYLFVNATAGICNVSNVKVSKGACAMILFFLSVTYSGGVLTTALMVVDTYLAILWPLRYSSILPPSRTKKLIVFLWITSLFSSAVMFLVLHFTQKPDTCHPDSCSLPLIFVMTLHAEEAIRLFHILCITAFLLCFSLIICCYVFLCYKTRQSGVWKSLSSRANITFMMHHFILFSYYLPLLLLLAESVLYINKIIDYRTSLLATFTICDVLIVLPKCISPYLYGFRYREIYRSLQLLHTFKLHVLVQPKNRLALSRGT